MADVNNTNEIKNDHLNVDEKEIIQNERTHEIENLLPIRKKRQALSKVVKRRGMTPIPPNIEIVIHLIAPSFHKKTSFRLLYSAKLYVCDVLLLCSQRYNQTY